MLELIAQLKNFRHRYSRREFIIILNWDFLFHKRNKQHQIFRGLYFGKNEHVVKIHWLVNKIWDNILIQSILISQVTVAKISKIEQTTIPSSPCRQRHCKKIKIYKMFKTPTISMVIIQNESTLNVLRIWKLHLVLSNRMHKKRNQKRNGYKKITSKWFHMTHTRNANIKISFSSKKIIFKYIFTVFLHKIGLQESFSNRKILKWLCSIEKKTYAVRNSGFWFLKSNEREEFEKRVKVWSKVFCNMCCLY